MGDRLESDRNDGNIGLSRGGTRSTHLDFIVLAAAGRTKDAVEVAAKGALSKGDCDKNTNKNFSKHIFQ